MKSKSIIITLYVALCLTCTAQSSIYNQFSQYRELRVAFVEKYKIDSTTVDVTVIMAQNDDDWQTLLKELGIENIDTATAPESNTTSSIRIINISRDAPFGLVSSKDKRPFDKAFISFAKRRIDIYHVHTKEQLKAIVRAELLKLKNQ